VTFNQRRPEPSSKNFEPKESSSATDPMQPAVDAMEEALQRKLGK
jgi:hypothetical protein